MAGGGTDRNRNIVVCSQGESPLEHESLITVLRRLQGVPCHLGQKTYPCPKSASESDVFLPELIYIKSSRFGAVCFTSCRSQRPSNASCSACIMSNTSYLWSTRTMLTAVASTWDTVSLIKVHKGPRWEVFNNSHVMMIIIQ